MSKRYEFQSSSVPKQVQTVGTKGIIIEFYNSGGHLIKTSTVLFKNIHRITDLVSLTGQNRYSFKIDCLTVETPYKVMTIDINTNSNEVYNAIKKNMVNKEALIL